MPIAKNGVHLKITLEEELCQITYFDQNQLYVMNRGYKPTFETKVIVTGH